MKPKNMLLDNALHWSWLVALVATMGSLYFSEVLHWLPCKLCWYQRILMYPLVLILGIAAVRKDYRQSIYVLPLSIIGACVSAYHYAMQKTDWLKSASSSCGPIPCDVDYINWLGFVTIPLLAFIAFILITVIHLYIWRNRRKVM